MGRGEIGKMHQTRLPPLRLITLAVLTVWATAGYAVGLGTIHVQSGLGQPLRASIALIGTDEEMDARCIKVKLESSDGVFMGIGQVALRRNAEVTSILVSTRQAMNEPAITAGVDVGCTTPIRREYQILLDPPSILALVDASNHAQQVNEESSSNNVQSTVLPYQAISNENGTSGSRKRTRTKRSPIQSADANSENESPLPPAETPKKSTKKVVRDMLKLSSGQTSPDSLKLSQYLSSPVVETDPVKSEEMRIAQLRFAAILRGEDASQSAESLVRETIAHAQRMQQEALQEKKVEIARLNKKNRAELEAVRKNSFSTSWIVGFSAALLFALATIAWLLSRLHITNKSSSTNWWENTGSAKKTAAPDSDLEIHTSELGDLNTASSIVSTVDSNENAVTETAKYANRNTKENSPISQLGQLGGVTAGLGLTSLENSNFSSFGSFPARATSLKVEEISDVTQEAEFWLSLNEPQRALDILEPQADVEHPDSPVPWLFLLDIYRNTRDRKKYHALRERFEKLFNARVPEFDEDSYPNPMQSLENYPHLMKQICSLWQSHGIDALLESLLVDNRDGTRVGFDLPVYRDILLLMTVSRELNRTGPDVGKKSPAVTNALARQKEIAGETSLASAAGATSFGPPVRPQAPAAAVPQSRIVSSAVLRSTLPGPTPSTAPVVAEKTVPRIPIPIPKSLPPDDDFVEPVEEHHKRTGFLGAIAGLGQFLFNIVRLKRTPMSSDSSILGKSDLRDSSLDSSLYGTDGGFSTDTYTSVFNSNFVSSVSQWDTNEVDPVAEADVYIAYGRDIQAEEILKDALQLQPQRHVVSVKLLEIYASRKDKRSFEVLATKLYRQTNGAGDDWELAASMGCILDPTNSLYVGGQSPDNVLQQPSVTTSPASSEADTDGWQENTQPVGWIEPELGLAEDPQIQVLPDAPTLPRYEAQLINSDANSTDHVDDSLGPDVVAAVLEQPQITEKNTTEIVADVWGVDMAGVDFDVETINAIADVEMPIDIKLDLGAVGLEIPHFKKSIPAYSAPAPASAKFVPSFLRADPEPEVTAHSPNTLAPSITNSAEANVSQNVSHPVSDSLPNNDQDTDIVPDAIDDASSHATEMEIKLGLVSAYQEIGDKEGARELIDEIIEGGSHEQIEKAKALRAKL